MHILYLSRSLLPSRTANSVQVMKMCQALAKNGHEVNLVASGANKTGREDIFNYYGVEKKFTITLLKGRTDKPAGLLRYLFNFYMFIKKINRPHLFYGRDLFTLTLATLASNIPFYFEAHKPPPTFVHFFLTWFLVRKKNLINFVVISRALEGEYLRRFPKHLRSKILVAPDGADIPEASISKQDYKNVNEVSVIGYVGHLYPGRGIEVIIALARNLPEYHFHIIGGNEKEIIDWQRISCKLDNIHFKGFVPHKELSRYYRDLDIVLAPYQHKVTISGGGDTGRWMSPLKIFEYMAFGKPIIASDLPVLKEVLTDRFNAILCSPTDIDEWAEAIKLLDRDQNLRSQIAANAFKSLQENFTWEKRAEKILEPFYNSQ